jgi:hypothetical protein
MSMLASIFHAGRCGCGLSSDCPVVVGFAGVWRAGSSRVVGVGGLSQGRGSFVFVGAGGSVVQGKAARMRCQAVAIAVAQRQVASMRRRSWRAPRVIRAAVCKTR